MGARSPVPRRQNPPRPTRRLARRSDGSSTPVGSEELDLDLELELAERGHEDDAEEDAL